MKEPSTTSLLEVMDGKIFFSLSNRPCYGDAKFIDQLEKKEGLQEVPREQRQPIRPPLSKLVKKEGTVEEIWKAHVNYGYRLKEISEELDVHYSTVGRRLGEWQNT